MAAAVQEQGERDSGGGLIKDSPRVLARPSCLIEAHPRSEPPAEARLGEENKSPRRG